jgi:hypothetical protein
MLALKIYRAFMSTAKAGMFQHGYAAAAFNNSKTIFAFSTDLPDVLCRRLLLAILKFQYRD